MKPIVFISRAIRIVFAVLLVFGPVDWAAKRPPVQAQAAVNNQRIFVPMVVKPHSFTQPANPMNLPVLLDPSRTTSGSTPVQPSTAQITIEKDENRTVQAVVPVAGGVITATAADGTLFTLEVPDGALAADTQIFMTPVAAIDGHPLGGSAGAAVQLDPDGLQFLLPVNLKIQPTTPIPVSSELSMSWHGDGQEFHRYPLAFEHPYPEVVFHIMHFSGYMYAGDNIWIQIDDDYPMPSDPEDQFKQAWDKIVSQEREAQANGGQGDPNFHHNLIELLRAYYFIIVKPIMAAAETDCSYAEDDVVARVMGWAKEADTLRTEDELAQEREEFDASFKRVLENCWQERTQPCLNRNDPNQWQEAVRIARIGQMFNLDFDPNAVPDCVCSGFNSISAWQLTFSMSFSRDASGVVDGGYSTVKTSVKHETSGTLLLGNKKGWPPYPGWDNLHDEPTGNASINDHDTYTLYDGRQYNSSAVGSGLTGGYGYLEIDEFTCTYTLRVDMSTHIVEEATEKETRERNVYVLGLYVLDHNAYSTDPATTVLSGSGSFDAGVGGPYIEHMNLSTVYGSGSLFNLLGSNVGYGQATWTLTPIQ